jgi:hypothetical protein
MSDKKITAADIQAQLDAATPDTDVRAIILSAIAGLTDNEAVIVLLNGNVDDLAKQLDAIKLELEAKGEDFAGVYKAYNELKAAPGAEDLQKQLDDAVTTIGELGNKLDLQEKTKDQPGILVKVGENEHRLLIGNKFTINKKVYNAKDVSESAELLEFLHSRNSGSLIKPVTDATN